MKAEEKRLHRRFKTDLTLEYRLLNAGPLEKEESEVLDFSESGLQFSSTGFIPSGVLTMFTINAGRSYHFLGTTVRSAQQDPHNNFAVGAALATADPEEVEDLKLLIDNYGRDA